jgi:predicted transcriptional regulator
MACCVASQICNVCLTFHVLEIEHRCWYYFVCFLYYLGQAMNMLTLKIPDELGSALREASRARGISKSALVREALEHLLRRQADQVGAAERWLAQWRGCLLLEPTVPTDAAELQDARLAHLLAKHLR